MCNGLDSTYLFPEFLPRFWSTSTLSKAVRRLAINTPPSHTRFHIVQVFNSCRVTHASLASPAYCPTTLVAWLCPASSTESYIKLEKKTRVAYLGRRLSNNPLQLINVRDLCRRSSPGKPEAHETCGNRTKRDIWCDRQNDGPQMVEN